MHIRNFVLVCNSTSYTFHIISYLFLNRHDAYKNQYRAMFVMNCDVQDTESLSFPKEKAMSKKQQKKLQRKHKRLKVEETELSAPSTSTDTMPDDTHSVAMDTGPDSFHPVKCSVCTTEVGVFDKNEIYHFFNVLASHG